MLLELYLEELTGKGAGSGKPGRSSTSHARRDQMVSRTYHMIIIQMMA